MRYFIHILTGNGRILDPDGEEFQDLQSARREACQCARDLMAKELREGRAVPFDWRVQIADEDGNVLHMIPFASLVFGRSGEAAAKLADSYDVSLIERAQASFVKARTQHNDIAEALKELRDSIGRLARINSGLGAP